MTDKRGKTPPNPVDPKTAGQVRVGPYRLGKKLGSGSFSKVYRKCSLSPFFHVQDEQFLLHNWLRLHLCCLTPATRCRFSTRCDCARFVCGIPLFLAGQSGAFPLSFFHTFLHLPFFVSLALIVILLSVWSRAFPHARAFLCVSVHIGAKVHWQMVKVLCNSSISLSPSRVLLCLWLSCVALCF